MIDDTEDIFTMATNYVKVIADKAVSSDLLYLYARYKQVTCGNCNIERPGFFDFQGKQKWDVWNSLANRDVKECQEEYINKLFTIDPLWLQKIQSGNVKSKSGMGVGVSTLKAEDSIDDSEKCVFDWCKEGNIEKVQEFLAHGHNINDLDENGLSLLHWSCDRGILPMVEFLLSKMADVNVKDSENQTPLHYASSCEYSNIISLLLLNKADKNIRDMNQLLPIDLTNNPYIHHLLQ